MNKKKIAEKSIIEKLLNTRKIVKAITNDEIIPDKNYSYKCVIDGFSY